MARMAEASNTQGTNPHSGYIVNPLYDFVFFILSPVLALLLGMGAAFSETAHADLVLFGWERPAIHMFMGVFIMAHLVIVFVRTHGNKKIYKLI